MGTRDLVEALVAQCLREIGNGGEIVLAGKAADWFWKNTVDVQLSEEEWKNLLVAFTDSLKTRGALKGH